MKKKNSAAAKAANAKTAESTSEDTGDIDMAKGAKKIKGVLGKLKKAYQGKPDTEEVIAEEIENEPATEKGASVLDNTSTAGLSSPAKRGSGKFAALANKTKKVC